LTAIYELFILIRKNIIFICLRRGVFWENDGTSSTIHLWAKKVLFPIKVIKKPFYAL
jgi:hypothetical protein